MAERGTVFVHAFGDQGEDVVFNAWDASKDWNDKSVLLMRSGGLGDAIFMTPILREMRRRWPTISISIACRKERFAVFDGLGLVNGHCPTPVSVELADTFDAVIAFEDVIEKERERHYVDCLAAQMGLPLPDGDAARRLEYEVGFFEKKIAGVKYARKPGVKRLGIQMSSGSLNRSYPKDQLGLVAQALIPKGWEVYLFGLKGDAPQSAKFPGVRNLTLEGLTFRQSAAALATCDVLLAPDSSLLWVAAALNLPAVALFAVISAKMRTAPYANITALEGRGKCAPCFHHYRGGVNFPKGQPCEKEGRCVVLAGISVERIVAAIEAKVSA